jgi:hypothetical protein
LQNKTRRYENGCASRIGFWEKPGARYGKLGELKGVEEIGHNLLTQVVACSPNIGRKSGPQLGFFN